ncbi:uncharacterized protein LOC135201375 [Macrobrachium nipponense]|uniref:uncharacterized protein LOC135201375 n=1 Tax=Macrobrachium nipponense TaxID=159736 RepID=UPI0030C7D79A
MALSPLRKLSSKIHLRHWQSYIMKFLPPYITTESHSRIQTGASSTSNSSSTGTVSSSAVRITAAEDPPLTSQYRGDVHHPSGSSVTRKSSSSDTRLLLGNDIEADAEDK